MFRSEWGGGVISIDRHFQKDFTRSERFDGDTTNSISSTLGAGRAVPAKRVVCLLFRLNFPHSKDLEVMRGNFAFVSRSRWLSVVIYWVWLVVRVLSLSFATDLMITCRFGAPAPLHSAKQHCPLLLLADRQVHLFLSHSIVSSSDNKRGNFTSKR